MWSILVKVWPAQEGDPSWRQQKLNDPTATASATVTISATQFIFKIEKVEVRWHKVSQCEIENVIYDWRAGGRWPRSPSPLTASHDLDSASAMLHSNGHLLLVLLDWTYLLSTTRHHQADGWNFQCATSRHYLVNCSCTVGFVKMDNLDLIRARNM